MNSRSKQVCIIGAMLVLLFLCVDRLYDKFQTLEGCANERSFVCLGKLDGMER